MNSRADASPTNDREPELFGCLDIPSPYSTLSGRSLLLSGWALSRSGPVRSVAAVIDGQLVMTAQPGVLRPDVALAHPDVPGSERSGFLFEVPFTRIPDGWHELSVRCQDESETTIDLGRRRVYLSQEMYLERQRKVRKILACPKCHGVLRENRTLICSDCGQQFLLVDGVPIFEKVQSALHPSTISVGSYVPHARAIINKFPDGLVLDCGAGYPRQHFANVIQLDIFQYPSTDVVGNALRLPFQDGMFDGVISQAVLEHVADPFQYASELYRVLRPGGLVLVDSAFLQPLHAFPNHFFNTTLDGLRQVMHAFATLEDGVGTHQKPWIMLRWVLTSYLKGIPDEEDRRAVLGMSLGEVLEILEHRESKSPFDPLSTKAERELAAGVFFYGTKAV